VIQTQEGQESGGGAGELMLERDILLGGEESGGMASDGFLPGWPP
jgi:hypothetical protein